MSTFTPSNQTQTLKHIIVMGVSGCGKSTLARDLATQLGWPLIEGDDFHPTANVRKMAAGEPLTDADRAPWLALLNAQLRTAPRAVLACSALKASHRRTLRAGIAEPLFVHCHGSFEVLFARMQARNNHFMPPVLLQSQFAALELPNAQLEAGLRCVTIDVQTPPNEAIAQLMQQLKHAA